MRKITKESDVPSTLLCTVNSVRDLMACWLLRCKRTWQQSEAALMLWLRHLRLDQMMVGRTFLLQWPEISPISHVFFLRLSLSGTGAFSHSKCFLPHFYKQQHPGHKCQIWPLKVCLKTFIGSCVNATNHGCDFHCLF